MTWGSVVRQNKAWTKKDIKLMTKLNVLLKEYHHNRYLNSKNI